MRVRALTVVISVVASLALAACGGSNSSSSSATAAASSGTGSGSSGQTQTGFEGVPIQSGSDIAPADTTQTGTVDGIRCGPTEQLAYHIHTHLAVFDKGRLYSLPAGIGIPGSTTQETSQGPVASRSRRRLRRRSSIATTAAISTTSHTDVARPTSWTKSITLGPT